MPIIEFRVNKIEMGYCYPGDMSLGMGALPDKLLPGYRLEGTIIYEDGETHDYWPTIPAV